jgi:hypothetical protein
MAYALRFGWRVAPTEPGTKLPCRRLLAHGHLEATTSREQIVRWWTAVPDAGVLVSCSASGLVVIDADLYKDDCGFSELEAKLGTLPETPRVLTRRGGVHYYFRDSVGSYRNPCAGVEAKHEGYVLAPATPGYRWDVGAHILETPLAELPDAWLAHLTARSRSVAGTALPSSGTDARESWLGLAFEAARWLGDMLPDGKRMVRCPWLHEHSDGRGDGTDSSCVLFPRAEGRTLGGWRCAHAHCEGRSWRDVVDALPVEAKRVADAAFVKERNRKTLEIIERSRKAVGW